MRENSVNQDLFEGQLTWSHALNGLDKRVLTKLSRSQRDRSLNAGENLFRQGELSEEFYILREGRVRVYKCHESGEEFTFNHCQPDTMLGLAAFLLKRPNAVSAQAVGSVWFSSITRQDFIECIEISPCFHKNITEIVASLALESMTHTTPLVLDTATARLANVLLKLSRRKADILYEDETLSSGLQVSQEELGRMIGTSRYWVGVTLKKFEQAGWISKSRTSIVIKNRLKLRNVVYSDRLGSQIT
ncbi:MAG: Crp/Fnr family transcriptional regulator [Sneathiellales bacterium]|nr:Crp/Fnr family transcriptional regulator [Sneathiellales bacterium]